MTLVMSMSVIGISADYTLYISPSGWCTATTFRRGKAWRSTQCPAAGAAHNRGGISDYDLAPFPGIRQMAIFAAVGLSAPV